MTEIWLTFLAGVAGSPHCFGMCGGIVAALTMACKDETAASRSRFHLWYNAGRISAYITLGVVAGLLGSLLDLLTLKELSCWLLVAAHLCVAAIGLGTLVAGSLHSPSCLGPLATLVTRVSARLVTGRSPWRALPIGFLLGFLPCGLVYAPLASVIASGSPLRGFVTMAALGFGTFPALFGIGVGTAYCSRPGSSWFIRVAGAIVLLLGIVGIWRALGAQGYLPPFPL
ncbi:MAG TPA: sulfite exporter TauE/SafE family protein [Geobacteraceae bacterium]